MDPACDGYSYWTIVDVMVPQAGTYTGQGFLNAFWEEKTGGLTCERFRDFNDSTVLLAKIGPESGIAVSGEVCAADLWISHFTPETYESTQLSWRLTADDEALAEGITPRFDARPGDVKKVAQISFAVPELPRPVHALLEVSLAGYEIHNHWDLWFFPKREKPDVSGIAVTEDLYEILNARYTGLVKANAHDAKSAHLIIGSWDHPDLLAAVATGKRGVMIGPAEGKPNIELGWWSLGDQVGTAFANHAVFGDFPHAQTLSPLWFRLIKRGMPLPIKSKYGKHIYYAVGEGQKQYFAYIFQKAGDTTPLLMTYGMDVLADTPEGAWLLDMFIHYMRGATV
ncbi:MAG TPA: hypothetical protein ENN29_02615 [Candidatus Hydrogenedentes bacterium]|nr:hypothetical protein [Candidatus Hydrogenedentota bacterium]